MPPKKIIDKSAVLQTAFELARTKGFDAINARSVAAALHSSTHPIFDAYDGLASLKRDVLHESWELYAAYIRAGAQENPPFRGTGRAYIRFAKEEPKLFAELFMTERQDCDAEYDGDPTISLVRTLGQSAAGITLSQAEEFHLHMWVFVHGIATLAATGVCDLSDAIISKLMHDEFFAMKHLLETERSTEAHADTDPQPPNTSTPRRKCRD